MTTTHEYTFIGMSYVNGKRSYRWLESTDEGDKVWMFHKNIVPNVTPGAVYKVTLTDRDTVLMSGPDGPRFLRMSDDDVTDEWRVAHEAAITRANADAQQRRLAREKRSMDDMTLTEIRTMLVGMRRPDRLATIANVLDALAVPSF